MSKKSKDKATKPRDEDEIVTEEIDSTAEDPDATPEVAPEPEQETQSDTSLPKQRASTGVAWLALILSLATLAAIAYIILADWRNQDTADQGSAAIASLESRLEASQASLPNLDRKIATLAKTNADMASRLESLQRDMDERIRLLDSLPMRMSALESSVASLQGVSAGTRDIWLLSEAEYYMQIANAQLQLAGNPRLAALALGMADERVVQLANPALIDIRAALSSELAALDVMEKPDIEGATLTLSSLARVVESLPLRGLDDSGADATDDVDSEELSGVDRALASVKDVMSGLVKVTPPNQAAAPLVTPDAVYFLRTNLTLQLQVARLALLRGETAVFEQSLDDASAWLERYFDTDSTQVAASLQTIAEIRGGHFSVTTPDISASLRLLRQFRTLTEPAQ